jgi:hypothetical protein
MNDLALNNVSMILGVDIDVNVLIETHVKYNKLLILRKKCDRLTYLKFVQNLRIIFLKLETQEINSNKIKT